MSTSPSLIELWVSEMDSDKTKLLHKELNCDDQKEKYELLNRHFSFDLSMVL